jgi:ADP-heptose:LPS heptosyltransferase
MNFAIVQLGRFGDMILATTMFRAIKEKYPCSKLHVIAGRHNYSIIENNPRIDSILIYEKSPLKLLKFIISLRKLKLDYLIDPKDHYSTESSIIARLANSKEKIGYNKLGKKVFTLVVPDESENYNKHYVERCFYTLKLFGIEMPKKIPKPELFTYEDSDKYVKNFIKDNKKTKIVINISASQPDKLWNVNNWKAVISSLNSEKYDLLLTFSPQEQTIADELEKEFTDKLIIFRSRSMNDVISLVKAGNFLITPDTSLVHVAAAFNYPLICLYNRNEKFYNKFYPLSDEKYVIQTPEGTNGIDNIKPEEVIKILNKLGFTY